MGCANDRCGAVSAQNRPACKAQYIVGVVVGSVAVRCGHRPESGVGLQIISRPEFKCCINCTVGDRQLPCRAGEGHCVAVGAQVRTCGTLVGDDLRIQHCLEMRRKFDAVVCALRQGKLPHVDGRRLTDPFHCVNVFILGMDRRKSVGEVDAVNERPALRHLNGPGQLHTEVRMGAVASVQSRDSM